MVATRHSVRLRVDLQSKSPIIFSYPDLLKRHEKTLKEAPAASMVLDDDDDDFYKTLLDRAAKYDMHPGGEDVDSGEEDNQFNKDTKGDEYDYEDPFIDDSEMMLDDSYEYSQPEFDGFFVYHGALDGSDNVTGTKKKANTRKEKSTAATGKAKASASTSARKAANNKADAIEISDTEEDHQLPNKPTPSTSTGTKAKKSASSTSQKPDNTTKGGPAMKKSTSSSTAALADTTKKASAKSSKTTIASTSAAPASASAAAKSAVTVNGASSSSAAINTAPSSSSPSTAPVSTAVAGDDNSKKSGKPSTSSKLQPLHPTLEPLMEKIRIDRAKESFEIKSKFPPKLRPTVLHMATKMFRIYHKVDENVINHLMDILPYNRFTMKKFLTTKAGPGIVTEYQQEIERLIEVLKTTVEEAMPEHLQQYEQKIKEQTADGPDAEKKFRCNESIRRTLYDILTLDMYSVNLSNEIAEFSSRPDMIESETKARKAMYAKLLPCWPTGWMTTYDISRQYSTYKAKMKNTEETSAKLGPSLPNTPITTATGNITSAHTPKRSTMTPIKRSAPSSSVNVYHSGSQGNGSAEKRKKTSLHETPNDSHPNRPASQEPTTQGNKPESDNVNIKSSSSIAENNPSTLSSAPSSHKPSSMNIASLISDP